MPTAKICEIRQETPLVRCFVLELEDEEFDFLPGQWIDLLVPIRGRVHIGGYSITSSPLQKGQIELAIRQAHHHPVTRYLHEKARVGDVLGVSVAQGNFYYHPQMGDNLVLIGGGIGVAPLMSIIRFVTESNPVARVKFLYSIRTPEEFVFRKELQALAHQFPGFHLHVTVTQPTGEPWNGPCGRFTARTLREADLDPRAIYYLCGSPTMTADISQALTTIGIPPYRLISETWQETAEG